MSRRFLLPVVSLALAALPLAAQQAQRDAGGYSATLTNYAALDIRSDGASRVLQNADDDSIQVPLGFPFSFYGKTYTAVWISTNPRT